MSLSHHLAHPFSSFLSFLAGFLWRSACRRLMGFCLLAGLLAAELAGAQRPALPDVPAATERFALALERACRSIGLRPGEITLRPDAVPPDEFRLAAFDRWLQSPLALPGDFDRAARGLLEGTWQDRLKQLGDWCDLPGETRVRQPGEEPGLRDTIASLWGREWPRIPVACRRTVYRLERQLPEEVQARLIRLLRLHLRIVSEGPGPLEGLSRRERLALQELLLRMLTEDVEDQKDLEEAEIERLLALTNKAPWKAFLQSVVQAGPEWERLLATPPVELSRIEDLKGLIVDWPTPRGRVIIGGVDTQTYLLDGSEPVLILDLGGDDLYRTAKEGAVAGFYEYIVDLGGNDRYEALSGPGFGAGVGSFSLLYDLAGDDRYEGTAMAFGAGLVGFGLCVDGGGNDRYVCDSGAFGLGYAGIGLLVDEEGNDQYFGHSGVQGVGAPGGVGVLLDRSGDDLYVAGNRYADKVERRPQGYINFSQGFGFGLRPYCSGGLGLLLDGAGDDRYVSSYFAQGSCYWLGVGALVDRAGNDTYETLRYSQGAGIHLGLGLLLDSGGHDVYNAWGVSQGCGHDLAVGFLWDSAGDDLYRGSWLYGGSGNANGFGFLVDVEGRDHYIPSAVEPHGERRAIGWGGYMEERDLDSLGFLLDLGGRDHFERGRWRDMHQVRGDVGVLIDLPEGGGEAE